MEVEMMVMVVVKEVRKWVLGRKETLTEGVTKTGVGSGCAVGPGMGGWCAGWRGEGKSALYCGREGGTAGWVSDGANEGWPQSSVFLLRSFLSQVIRKVAKSKIFTRSARIVLRLLPLGRAGLGWRSQSALCYNSAELGLDSK
ncbi:hypothetical protein E2C01_046971 [Portunus trituberculatus]|uniref:Uncharacterized protein n=1 Tax=Portunus trituberculatus TaxID=210409 RepID=A0A5B7G6G9_PORTR|nr:hypothetical protein [Portunus trituberculatus]